MTNGQGRSMLHLVSKSDALERDCVVLPLGDASAANQERRVLLSEAEAIEAARGKNPYSDYLRKHHKRPENEEAAAIGRLIGGRVLAADGKMEPPLSRADRDALKGIKGRRAAASKRYEQIIRLRSAIAALSQNMDDPAVLIAGGSVLFDSPEISLQLDDALCWLSRFAEEWHSREKEARA